MTTAEIALPSPTIIDIKLSISAQNDSTYKGRCEPMFILSSTTPFNRMRYRHLGFPFRWEKFILQRDGKCITHCWLLPFTLVRINIPPFDLVIDNLGDGQVGIYLKIARDMTPYRMVIMQEGKRDQEIEEYTFERIRYAVARVNELQTVHIEEIAQEENV